jgi:hypothetical protein
MLALVPTTDKSADRIFLHWKSLRHRRPACAAGRAYKQNESMLFCALRLLAVPAGGRRSPPARFCHVLCRLCPCGGWRPTSRRQGACGPRSGCGLDRGRTARRGAGTDKAGSVEWDSHAVRHLGDPRPFQHPLGVARRTVGHSGNPQIYTNSYTRGKNEKIL